MSFKIHSHIDFQPRGKTDDELRNSARILRWVNEKGYFSQKLINDGIDRCLGHDSNWPGKGKFAEATFDRIANEGGQGISIDKFIAEFDAVLDTKHPGVRKALTGVKDLLIFFSHFPFEASGKEADALSYSGFLRALAIHAEINPLFDSVPSALVDVVLDDHVGGKIRTDVPKTSSDLRRLFFRSLASPLPQSEDIIDRTYLPVLHFIWHEHEQDANGHLSHVEHRVFELEDERTIELQDMLAMSQTRMIPTRLIAPYYRDDYEVAMHKLPVFKHDLRQLGVRRESLLLFISLLSTIDPGQPGFETFAGDGSFGKQLNHWEKVLVDADEYVEYVHFDELLKTQLPHYYVQLSKLIGLLMVERSADGGYAGETDRHKIDFPVADKMQYRLRMYTAPQRGESRELLDSFFLDAVDVITPLWGCHKCWELGFISDDIMGDEYILS